MSHASSKSKGRQRVYTAEQRKQNRKETQKKYRLKMKQQKTEAKQAEAKCAPKTTNYRENKKRVTRKHTNPPYPGGPSVSYNHYELAPETIRKRR